MIGHNHFDKGIAPLGECPVCDIYHGAVERRASREKAYKAAKKELRRLAQRESTTSTR